LLFHNPAGAANRSAKEKLVDKDWDVDMGKEEDKERKIGIPLQIITIVIIKKGVVTMNKLSYL